MRRLAVHSRIRWITGAVAAVVAVITIAAVVSSASPVLAEVAPTVTSATPSSTSEVTSSSSPASGSPGSATLRVLDDGVAVQSPAGDFATAVDGQVVAEGFTIRTDDSGRAVIEYFDGSLTRLDSSTTLTISTLKVLDNDARSKVIVALLSEGSTYSNVVALTDPDSRFEVLTTTASVSVIGTRYFVHVDPVTGATIVVVVEGTVTVADPGDPTRLVDVPDGSMVTFGTDGVFEMTDRIPDDLLPTGWVEYNCEQDVVLLGGVGDCAPAAETTTTTVPATPTTGATTTTTLATTTTTTVAATTTGATTTTTTTFAATTTTVATTTPTTSDANQAPLVTTPANRSSAEADLVTLGIPGSDPDGNQITWSAIGLPDGLSIDSTTGVISGTLGYTSSGAHTVTARATDDGVPVLFTEVRFLWSVTNTNRAPVATTEATTTSEDTTVVFDLDATDPDGDAVTTRITLVPSHGGLYDVTDGGLCGPTRLGVGDVAASVCYRPLRDYSGADGLKYTATDTLAAGVGGSSLTSNARTVTLTVSAVNDAPVAGVSSDYVDPSAAGYLDAHATSLNLSATYFPVPLGNDGEVTLTLIGQDVDNTQSELVAVVEINNDPVTKLGNYFQYCGGCASPVPVDTAGPNRGVVTDPGHRVVWRTIARPPIAPPPGPGVYPEVPLDLSEALRYTLVDASGAVSNVKTIIADVKFTSLPIDLPPTVPPPPSTTTTMSSGSTPAPTQPPDGCSPFDCSGW